MPYAPVILDASALLAMVLDEKGAEAVEKTLKEGAYMTTVNLAETITKLLREGFALEDIKGLLLSMPIARIAVDESLAYEAASYDSLTRPFGLSLGDRICLAAAQQRGYTAMTADRVWDTLPLDISVQLIR